MSHAHFFRLKILVRYNGHNQRLFLLQNSKLKTQPRILIPLVTIPLRLQQSICKKTTI